MRPQKLRPGHKVDHCCMYIRKDKVQLSQYVMRPQKLRPGHKVDHCCMYIRKIKCSYLNNAATEIEARVLFLVWTPAKYNLIFLLVTVAT